MRSGGYTLHHSLTQEAASIVKQALTLARRRGHSQVTPLHVASAMLASPTALLKGACLQSHSHPLQCKALELCFNVALNRLPTSASSPLLGPHSHLPSLSNALVAAFKRAQAHQRRGSIESQQQPILALKVEVEQLVISILDDPSVSRVMREAGFSSSQVKSNVEQAKCTNPQSKESKILLLGNSISHTQPTPSLTQFRFPSPITTKTLQNNEISIVLEAMASKKTRNTVIVGECRATNESIINGVIEKINRNDVADQMKSVQFISVPLSTLKNISKEEFEIKIGELRALMKSYVSRGVVLYLGDLDWVSGYWARYGEQRSVFFCPVEYMIMELSRLACGSNGDSRRVWIMGFASSQTYAKCRIGRPSLEALWSLHPLTLPAVGSLALSLSLDSGMHEEVKKEPVEDYSWLCGMKKKLICCSDCSENFMKEAEALSNGEKELISSSSSRLPSWLQQYKDIESRKQLQESDRIKDLCNKWNSICNSVHKKPHFLEKVFNVSSSSPSSSSSLSSNRYKAQKALPNWPTIFERNELGEVSKPELLSNPNSSPNSASSSEASGDMDFNRKFDELNSENVEFLTDALEKKVPLPRQIVSEVITTILKCRSGIMRNHREDSWLLFSGDDSDAKEIAAKELANAVFGSEENFVAIGTSSFATARADSTGEVSDSRKRGRNDGVFDRFCDAVRCNPSRVFCIGDVDEIDYRCLRAMRDGSVGEEVLLKDAIVVFSCESGACSPPGDGGKREKEEREEGKQCGLLDLNVATEEDEDSVRGVGILGWVDMQVVFKSPNAVNLM